MFIHVHVATKIYFLEWYFCSCGAYIISYNLHIAPVYLIASCTNGLQYMHSVLHRNKKDILVRTERVFIHLSKSTFKAFNSKLSFVYNAPQFVNHAKPLRLNAK